MATPDPKLPNLATPVTHTDANGWAQLLTAESSRLDETGVLAALVSVRLASADDRSTTQTYHLLRRSINRIERAHVVEQGHLSLVLAPVADFVDLRQRTNALQNQLVDAGLKAWIGFALRRPLEPLLDTWARAEAELDRLTFRIERSHINLVNPES